MKKNFLVLSLTCLMLLINISEATPNIQQEMVDFLKPKLNSERIECFFGNYDIETLAINSSIFPFSRIANLHSIHEGKKIMRTLAIVEFFQPIHPDLQNVHYKIIVGKSIGVTLREHNWIIYKRPVYFGRISLPQNVMDSMNEHERTIAPIHVYQLDVSQNNPSDFFPYCSIIEIHSPQYLTTEWLRALYDDQYEQFSIPSKEAEDLLSRLSLFFQEFSLISETAAPLETKEKDFE